MSNVPKPILVLLSVSLALNLFAVGIWAGRHWSSRDRDGDALGVHAFLRRSGLSDAGPGVQQIVHAQRAAIRQRMQELGEARVQVRAALQAEPFDRPKLEAALSNLETHMTDVQRQMHGALIEVAAAVDTPHRHRMAEALWPRHGFGRRQP